MKAKIVQKRLRQLWKDSGKTQKEISDEIWISRSTFSLLCSDKKEYPHALDEDTITRIANFFHVDPKYLTGESDYMNVAHFMTTSIDKYTEAQCIGEMLVRLGIVEPSEDKKYMRLSAKENSDSIFIHDPVYIDMNELEYSVFTTYLAEQIRSACDNYVKISSARKVYGFDDYDE